MAGMQPGSILMTVILMVLRLNGGFSYNAFLSSDHINTWYTSPKAASILTIPLLIFLACQLTSHCSFSWPFELQIQYKTITTGSRATAYLWPGNLEETIFSQKILSGCA